MKNTVSNGMDNSVAVEFSVRTNDGQQADNVCISLIDDESDTENDMSSAVEPHNTNLVDSAA